MVYAVKQFGKRLLQKATPELYERLKDKRHHPEREAINLILKDSASPTAYDSEEVFVDLQSRYKPFPSYGYDSYSTWKRGVERAVYLGETIDSLKEPGKKVFEAGSGDAMVAFALTQYGHKVTTMDKEDWRDTRAKNLKFIQNDLSTAIPIKDNSMDVCYSFNTFEHVTDPSVTFNELLRICKSGGFIYLDFNPLYASAWGMHLYRSLRMPYCQYLFSFNRILELKKNMGVNDIGQINEPLQPLNKWRLEQFMKLWNREDCEVVVCEKAEDKRHLALIKEFPFAFCGRGLTYDDVMSTGIRVLIRKI